MARFATTESAEVSRTPHPAPCPTCGEATKAVELLLTRLDIAPAAVVSAARLLSDAEQQRGARFAFVRDRSRYTVAHSWLRRLLGARLGVRPEAVELVYGQHGKPALAPHFAASALSFNLSCSQNLAVCALTSGREIGIDIERVLPLAAITPMGDRFFSQREQVSYRTLTEQDKAQGFFNCWTRKEAFIKALGLGLSLPLDTFDVTLAPGEPARILRVGSSAGEHCGWKLHSFIPCPGFVGAVVVREQDAAPPPALCPQVH